METIQTFAIMLFFSLSISVHAQEMPSVISEALKSDDTVKLAALINKDNINNCYDESGRSYSLLSQTIRYNAPNCFQWLIARNADVNLSCNGYVPPLMHAAKYGRLDMVKKLVAKGADINYKYTGDYAPANGQTPITYAELYNHSEIADYLRSVKK